MDLKTILTKQFGGLTIYQRTPVTGLWQEDNGQTIRDEIVIYEVLVSEIDLDTGDPLKKNIKLNFSKKNL